MGKRKKIAVFSPNIYEPMAHAIQDGISKAALELGIKAIFFVTFSDDFTTRLYDEYKNYDEGDIADSVMFRSRSSTSADRIPATSMS